MNKAHVRLLRPLLVLACAGLFSRSLQAACSPVSASVIGTADDAIDIYVNGTMVATFGFVNAGSAAPTPVAINPALFTETGNVIAAVVRNTAPSAVLGSFGITVVCSDGSRSYITSDDFPTVYFDDTNTAPPPNNGGLNWTQPGWTDAGNLFSGTPVEVTAWTWNKPTYNPKTGQLLRQIGRNSSGSSAGGNDRIYFHGTFDLSSQPYVPPTFTILKTSSTGSVGSQGPVVYTIKVCNSGAPTTDPVVIRDYPPTWSGSAGYMSSPSSFNGPPSDPVTSTGANPILFTYADGFPGNGACRTLTYTITMPWFDATACTMTNRAEVYFQGAVQGSDSSVTTNTTNSCAASSPTRTKTPAAPPTATRTRTPTPSLTATRTNSPSPSASPTASLTATRSATPSATPTRTATSTHSPTQSPGPSPTSSDTPTLTPSRSPTPTQTLTATLTASPTTSPTRSATPSPTMTPSGTGSMTPSGTATPTRTVTLTATATPSITATPVYSATITPTVTATATPSPSFSATATLTASPTQTVTATPSPTMTPTGTGSMTPSRTLSFTQTRTLSDTPTQTLTLTPSPSASATASFTVSPTVSPTPIPVPFQVTLRVYNSAGELVREVYRGAAAALPVTLDPDKLAFIAAQDEVKLPMGGRLADGSSSLSWNGRNDGGQAVSAGIYTLKLEAKDSFGQTTSLTVSLSVLPAGSESWLRLYNSAGEQVWQQSLSQPAMGFSLSSLVVAVPGEGQPRGQAPLSITLQLSGGGAQPLDWDGRGANGSLVASGSYSLLLSSTEPGQSAQVQSAKITVLRGPDADGFGSALLGPNPAVSVDHVELRYTPLAGAPASAALYTLDGGRVAQADDPAMSGVLRLPIGRLSSGVYACVFAQGLQRRVLKLAVVQ